MLTNRLKLAARLGLCTAVFAACGTNTASNEPGSVSDAGLDSISEGGSNNSTGHGGSTGTGGGTTEAGAGGATIGSGGQAGNAGLGGSAGESGSAGTAGLGGAAGFSGDASVSSDADGALDAHGADGFEAGGSSGASGGAGTAGTGSYGADAGDGAAAGGSGDGGSAGSAGVDASAGASGESGAGGAAGSGGEAGADIDAGTGGAGMGGAAGHGGAGGTGTGGGCNCGPLEECFNGAFCVARMVQVPGGFSIGATEVTRAQYKAWLVTNPSISQAYSCGWNSTFVPDPNCMSSSDCKVDCENHPQICVDWCDAVAYCKGIGKRLCGSISGGPTPYSSYNDVTKSQWYNACTSGGLHAWPYGGNYEKETCNGSDNSTWGCAAWGCSGGCACSTAEVGSLLGCQSSEGGFEGVYDLSGNVEEWEDSCDASTGKLDRCRQRGGKNWYTIDSATSCAADSKDYRNWRGADLGLRCCSL